jgi:hypothetical protein
VLVKYQGNLWAVWIVAALMLVAIIWSIRASNKPAERIDMEVAPISGD